MDRTRGLQGTDKATALFTQFASPITFGNKDILARKYSIHRATGDDGSDKTPGIFTEFNLSLVSCYDYQRLVCANSCIYSAAAYDGANKTPGILTELNLSVFDLYNIHTELVLLAFVDAFRHCGRMKKRRDTLFAYLL